MNLFNSVSKPLQNALADLGYNEPTPIQNETFSIILSGRDLVGIAQTGTGKTLAYCLPILDQLKYSTQLHPRILILVPTRELVNQVVDNINSYSKFLSLRIIGVYGGTNINTQKIAVAKGIDILVATPGRLYDLVISRSIQLKEIKKLVIDEVDEMLDLGFRFQLTNIFQLLPQKKQNLMFSATMTQDVDLLINDFFNNPKKISIAISGTPLKNISQQSYLIPNFYTKINLLAHLLSNNKEFEKVLVFVASKKHADLIYEKLSELNIDDIGVVHSNKSQNYRFRTIKQFEDKSKRILITTDIMARGLDLDEISHVISFDTPLFPENYIHRIGRTGRAEKQGNAILFSSEKEEALKAKIEQLMAVEIPITTTPSSIKISSELISDEKPIIKQSYNPGSKLKKTGEAFHEKSEKNLKQNKGGSYKRKLAKKYKKPKTKGDKNFNRRKKK